MISYKTLLLLFGLACLVSSHSEDFTCNHDELEFEAKGLNVEEDMSSLSAGRLLASGDYPKMRIYGHYDFLDTAPASFRAYIKNELAPPVLSFISNALRIKFPIKGLLQVDDDTVCDKDTPSELQKGIETDLMVIFDSRSEDSSTVASSKYCYLATGTNRPLISYVNINRQMLIEAKGDILLHEKNMYLLIHEIFHTLGISKNSYNNFIDENGKRRTGHMKKRTLGGVTHTLIDIPALTNRIRKFYGCSTIEGAVMENDGGSGTALSHFERKFFVYEVMASGGIFGRRVSEFSLALLEGSGWYIPDYKYAEPYFYGQGQGCSFLTEKCSSSKALFEEFCTGTERGCAPHGRSGGKCSADSKANGCRYVDPDPDFDCENPDAEDNARLPELQVFGRGAGSKCFSGTLNKRQSTGGVTSFCFKYNCVGSGSDTVVEVQVGRNKVVCETKGQRVINGYYGFVNCPDPIQFCSTVGKKYCPRNCMGRGKCVDNKCQCDSGFKGIDCGLYV